MGKGSRDKGNEFERLVAKLILERFDGVSKADCYRTPMSGGHPYADAGDLCISDKLWELFPYIVECKHTKSWYPAHLLPPLTLQVCRWIQQARNARNRINFASRRGLGEWLLVMRSNNTPIYCVTPLPKCSLSAMMTWMDRGAVILGGKALQLAELLDTPEQLLVAMRFDRFLD